eukprot:7643136-Karenia_brevis.AAC.1
MLKQAWAPELQSAAGKSNVYSGLCGSKAEYKESAQNLVKHFGDVDSAPERLRMYARTADTAARLLNISLMSMSFTAKCTDMKGWAQSVPNVQSQPPEIQEWIRHPSNKSLAKAVASVNFQRCQKINV